MRAGYKSQDEITGRDSSTKWRFPLGSLNVFTNPLMVVGGVSISIHRFLRHQQPI